MKTSITHNSVLIDKGRERARVLLVSLLITTGTITNCYQVFAQNIPNERLFAELQNIQALTRPNRTAETEAPRRVFVRSKSLLIRAAVVEDKLLKRPEFTQLGFVITRDEADADLILELRHHLFSRYVFSVVDVKTQIVQASGIVSSLGGTVAGKVANRFVRDMARIRTP